MPWNHATTPSLGQTSWMTTGTTDGTLCSGALAGNPFGVDRQAIAQDLGMAGVCPNSMDAVSDRDYVLETCFFAATLLTHLSRWAEDLIIYSSGAFGYVQCSDAYATGARHGSACSLPRMRQLGRREQSAGCAGSWTTGCCP